MMDEELCLRVVRDIFRARRWKFWEDMRFLLGSLSGSGVPVRDGGEFTLAPKVTAGIGPGRATGSSLQMTGGLASELGKVIGFEMGVGAGRVTGSSLRMTGGLTSELGKVIGAEMGVGDRTGTSIVCVILS